MEVDNAGRAPIAYELARNATGPWELSALDGCPPKGGFSAYAYALFNIDLIDPVLDSHNIAY